MRLLDSYESPEILERDNLLNNDRAIINLLERAG